MTVLHVVISIECFGRCGLGFMANREYSASGFHVGYEDHVSGVHEVPLWSMYGGKVMRHRCASDVLQERLLLYKRRISRERLEQTRMGLDSSNAK